MNRITQYEIPRAVDSDTGYGNESQFRSALAESDNLAPLSESDRRWLADIDAAYEAGYDDGRRGNQFPDAGKLVPVDAGGVGIVWCIILAGLALWGVVAIVNWLAGW